MNKLYPDVPFDKIQIIRAIHSIAETRYEVCIPKKHDVKFRILKEKFNMNYSISLKGSRKFKGISIDHKLPLTKVGTIGRSLLFPHSIVQYCRTLWKRDRIHKFSFAGLITEKREKVLELFIKRNIDKEFFFIKKSPILKFISKIKYSTRNGIRQIGDLIFWDSNRGRSFPIKSWDDEYYRLLANSKFIMCPVGDYIWTYRFFETILCGAIPIVENGCPEYDGFTYFKMNEDISNFEWTSEVAENNYKLCVSRLTVPVDDLNREIEKFLK